MSSSRSHTAIRAARAASWAYALLVVAVCAFLCLFIVMPGQLFLLFATGFPDTASIRIVRGYGELWRPTSWHQAIQTQWGADTSALRAASHSDGELHSSDSGSSDAVQPVPTATYPSETISFPPQAGVPAAVDSAATTAVPSASGADLAAGSQNVPAPPDAADAPEAPSVYVAEFIATAEVSTSPQGAVEVPLESTETVVDTADMVSALLENRPLTPVPTTPWLMDIEVRKSPAEWQEAYLRLQTGDEDINFQSAGHVSPWFGDFMEHGVTLCKLHGWPLTRSMSWNTPLQVQGPWKASCRHEHTRRS